MSGIDGEAATVAATEAATVQRIEIVGERRRVHDASFRAEVLSEALTAGARIKQVARRYGICASLIYHWRREASLLVKPGSAVQLVPVRVAEPRAAGKHIPRAAPSSPPPPRRGVIEIELDDGVRVRVDSDVSLAALRRVVTALRG